MKIELSDDINRINTLLSIDNLGLSMAQYDNMPYMFYNDIGSASVLIVSVDDQDIGLFILDPLSYISHYNIHTGFIKSARGFQAYAGGMLMLDFIKSLLPHALLVGMIPATKPYAIKYALSLGFELSANIGQAIEIGTKNTNDLQRVDMAVLTKNLG